LVVVLEQQEIILKYLEKQQNKRTSDAVISRRLFGSYETNTQ
jgi:hypothetical protein